jgi:two-component system cell cycle response regulator
MTGKVLVIDDLLPNVKLLEAKLSAEYYDVTPAMSGAEGIEKAKAILPDIILLDVMMPEMDGFQTCIKMKADPDIMHIPVVMVTALSDMQDRIKGLEAGADDFITKPINDVHLLARVRSLVRVKLMLDELRIRDKTSLEFGLETSKHPESVIGNILLIDDDVVQSRGMEKHLVAKGHSVMLAQPTEALEVIAAHAFDLVIVSTLLADADGLRLCSQIRSQEKSRQIPILILVEEEERQLLVKGLEMGLNDYLICPVDANELVARARTQIRRKHYQDALRGSVEQTLNMAIVDSLTKLYNRRYLDVHLHNMVEQALIKKTELSVLTIDIDHFKQVNDGPGLGHHIGDEVLKQIADRIRNSIRTTDLATRPGGEEFVILMPNTNIKQAAEVAERMRNTVETIAFEISARDGKLSCTVSIGVAEINKAGDTSIELLKRADAALYRAKHEGRNRVVVSQSTVILAKM